MSYWNGTRLRTGWLRLRGNASGRNGFIGRMFAPWFCSGCNRKHGGKCERTIALDGKAYCGRTYWQAHDRIRLGK